jgi:hypothetical protein
MITVAWVFVIMAAVLARQAIKGRAANTMEDVHDAFLALVDGNWSELGSVFGRSGNTALVPISVTAGDAAVAGAALGTAGASTALLGEVRRLGASAKGYRWGGVGPSYYDCSGLVWRALKNLGLYKGARFTTLTFPSATKGVTTKVSTPAVGDIVVWVKAVSPFGHMGVVSGPDRFYSALSSKSGIKESSIKGHSGTPSYYRVVAK